MNDSFFRTKLLIGEENFEKIKTKKIFIAGVGGVGGFVVESLARCGIENITIVDFDTIDVTNINRQLIANMNTIGEKKVDLIKKRILEINPNINVTIHFSKILPENIEQYNLQKFDYIIDAIDSFESKIALIKKANLEKINIISSMGCGNRLDPTKLAISDIFKTQNCPLARKMRSRLKKEKIYKLKVVSSTELPILKATNRQIGIPSISFVPAAAGLFIASEVFNDLMSN